MKSRTWWRPVLILLAILAWFGVGGVGGQTFGVLSQVQENDNAAFLPASAESTLAAEAHAMFVPSDSVPGLFVIDGVTAADLPALQVWADEVSAMHLENDPEDRTVGEVLTAPAVAIPAQDGQAALIVFSIDADAYANTTGEDSLGDMFAATVRGAWADSGPTGEGYLTGPVGIVADLVEAFSGIDGVLLLVAMAVVLVILLVVYRSPILPLLVLMTAMIALSAAIVFVYALAKADVITLNGQSQGIMFILVVGATTDYALLLVARYREELLHTQSPYAAMLTAWKRSIEPIAASAGTVILGLLVLLLSDLKSSAALGPAGAIGIAAALLAVLTLLPALLLLGGRRARAVFWPRMPRYLGEDSVEAQTVDAVEARAGMWGRVSRMVDARPRAVWLVSGGVLLVMAGGLTQIEADGLGDADVFLTPTESIDGFAVLEDHFPAGATSPVRIIVASDDADAVLEAVAAVEGVDSAYVLTPAIIQGAPPGVVPEEPTVVDGRVEIEAVTSASASSREAQGVAAVIRDVVNAAAPDALVGGQSAEALDSKLTSQHDLKVILPVILAVILVVLIGLLRSLVAPLLIVAANIVSFGAALGVSGFVFEFIFKFPGMDPGTPLLAFVFLVALGVDYSIFLMSRAREEALRYGTRQGVRRALAVTGGVITSAGIVLAATFAALGVLPLIFLAQIAFIVGVGVLIDTFVVRSLLVPGLISDLGRKAWWPAQSKVPHD